MRSDMIAALALAAIVPGALAIGISNVTSCTADTQFLVNDQSQTPCLVVAYLLSVCSSSGDFSVAPLLNSSFSYSPPSTTNIGITKCSCSGAVYNLVAACDYCQGSTSGSFSAWTQNCNSDTITNAGFPSTLPPGTSVPNWAYTDATTWPGGSFNITLARQIGDRPESSRPASASTTSASSASSSSSASAATTTTNSSGSGGNKGSGGSSHTGAIVGGVVGGIVGLGLILLAAFALFLRNKKKNAAGNGGGGDQQYGAGGVDQYGNGKYADTAMGPGSTTAYTNNTGPTSPTHTHGGFGQSPTNGGFAPTSPMHGSGGMQGQQGAFYGSPPNSGHGAAFPTPQNPGFGQGYTGVGEVH